MEFAEAIDNSELESFGFTDEFIIDVWGIVTDAKSGRDSRNQEELDDGSIDAKHNMPPGRRSRLK